MIQSETGSQISITSHRWDSISILIDWSKPISLKLTMCELTKCLVTLSQPSHALTGLLSQKHDSKVNQKTWTYSHAASCMTWCGVSGQLSMQSTITHEENNSFISYQSPNSSSAFHRPLSNCNISMSTQGGSLNPKNSNILFSERARSNRVVLRSGWCKLRLWGLSGFRYLVLALVMPSESQQLLMLPRHKVDRSILQQCWEDEEKTHRHPDVYGLHIGDLKHKHTPDASARGLRSSLSMDIESPSSPSLNFDYVVGRNVVSMRVTDWWKHHT